MFDPRPALWELLWTKWHWGRYFSEYFRFPLSVSFRKWSILNLHATLAWRTNRPNRPNLGTLKKNTIWESRDIGQRSACLYSESGQTRHKNRGEQARLGALISALVCSAPAQLLCCQYPVDRMLDMDTASGISGIYRWFRGPPVWGSIPGRGGHFCLHHNTQTSSWAKHAVYPFDTEGQSGRDVT